MKVAVLSDVQANQPALDAAADEILAWGPDLVVMAGDLINRGPSSRACLERFDALRQTSGWLPVNGNHEVWVLRCAERPPTSPIDGQMRRFADWTCTQITPVQHLLANWPDHLCFAGPGHRAWVHVAHGTLLGNRDGISASLPDAALAERVPSELAVFVTAHTHKPLIRQFGGTLILNVGSVGSPFDGDPRGSYGRLEWRGGRWHAEICRFAYDRDQTDRDFHESGFLSEGGPLVRILYEEWRRAQLLMPTWVEAYRDAVLAEKIGLDEAVDAFLARLD
ncbi:metallophosphoesterase family protein [Thioalkalicoccus limnaeus]|uniref:Metallophosphoesterase family protein n=1 Tax=Thioalkalicoccus limnaeus TaxID=120681 RepID=A0ABV4BF48_9GAMM